MGSCSKTDIPIPDEGVDPFGRSGTASPPGIDDTEPATVPSDEVEDAPESLLSILEFWPIPAIWLAPPTTGTSTTTDSVIELAAIEDEGAGGIAASRAASLARTRALSFAHHGYSSCKNSSKEQSLQILETLLGARLEEEERL
jgi:hypothetical protein